MLSKAVHGGLKNSEQKPESAKPSPSAQPPRCPQCGSQRIWKDGVRCTRDGDVQRYICRECGHRFSQTSINCSDPPEYAERLHTNKSYRSRGYILDRQISATQPKGAKNLAEVESRIEKRAAGATAKPIEGDTKGKIFEFAWWMKKQGYKQSTIGEYPEIIKVLAKRGANIFEPESVKEVIAQQETWCTNRKHLVTNVYATFLRFQGRTWDPPLYKCVEKLPFIPTEAEINQLIAACSRKLGAFLQLLKETGMRPGEAWALKWFNIDIERKTVTVNDPEKGSNPRILNIGSQLAARLELLPKHTEYVFRKTCDQPLRNWTTNFLERRKTIARKLNNPRLLKITFKTLRHFKGTVLYHKTKDILYVKEVLGHKNIQNTLIYIHLEAAIFKLGSDEFTVRAARTVEEAKKLLEVGFEYVTEMESVKLFRKRK